jgi:hypothetical protein
MRDLDQIGRLIEAAPEPVMMKAWYALQRRLYGIADNRPLHLLAVSFAGFTVRRFAPARRPTDPAFIGGIREAGRTIVRGIDQRDGSLAWQGLDRARTLLIPGRRQLLPA